MSQLKQLENKIRKLEKSDLSEVNKSILNRFVHKCKSENMSPRRIIKYLNYLSQQASFLKKDFDKTEKEDIEKLIIWIEEQDWAEWTKYDNKVMLRKFYKWLEGDDEEYPKKVRWIKPKIKNNKLMSPDEILSDEDIKKMIQNCTNIRDKAIISVLYESGCRISELLNMKRKDAQQDEFGFVIHVTGKTGPRRVRLLDSLPYLSNWLENHPGKTDRSSDLWVCIGTMNHAKKMQYNTIRKLLIELAKKCNITKPINPHAFRKANSTKLAASMTEFELKERQGWTQSSRMASVYVRLSGKNVDDAYFRAKGICTKCKKEKAINNHLCGQCLNGANTIENTLEPRICPRCSHKCESIANACSQCAFPLSEKTAHELMKRRNKADKIMNVATEYPELMVVLEKIMKKERIV